MRTTQAVWLLGLSVAALVGCTKPCETTAQCGDGEMCAASICQALACDKTIFAVNPATGECTPLSGCYLTDEQRGWRSCADDPCAGLDESGCVGDARCQPIYNNPNVDPPKPGQSGGGTVASDAVRGCAVDVFNPPVPPDGKQMVTAPGVNNGEAPKHPTTSSPCSSIDNSARAFSGCRAAPKIEPFRTCESLTSAQCNLRRDCSTKPPGDGANGGTILVSPTPAPIGANIPVDGSSPPFLGQCWSRFPLPATDCSTAAATSCLLNPACQPIGTRCYCPPGASCSCGDGGFLGCESNDRLRRCRASSDCRADERCDNDEACIAPRTFASDPAGSTPVPGTASCVGACVPKGCAGMGEVMCNSHPECDGGSYGTVCRPKPYCAGGNGPIDDTNPRADQATSGSCGCDAEFVGCADQKPLSDLRPERSLLVRDPEIIDDPAFRLDTVLGRLAPAGRVDDFTASLLKGVGAASTLSNGATANVRNGYATFLTDLAPATAGITGRLAGLLHITALVNRLDLAKPGSCGEARLTYALTSAYSDGNQRMTLIVELRVPDDGKSCRTVAQRWAELSLVDSADERRTRLIALYNELLAPEHVGQIRTNEFLNRTGKEPWELRELHIDNASGLLVQVPVAQTIDKRFVASSELLTWLQKNSADLKAGNATIPTQYLAAASTEDGGRLKLGSSDPVLQQAEKDVNAQACAGCHLTETQSPFVHVGERLGKHVGGATGYLPVGRAVIDTFLQKELVTRAANLQHVLSAPAASLLPVQRTGLARVH